MNQAIFCLAVVAAALLGPVAGSLLCSFSNLNAQSLAQKYFYRIANKSHRPSSHAASHIFCFANMLDLVRSGPYVVWVNIVKEPTTGTMYY
jgi:hypothetical protein